MVYINASQSIQTVLDKVEMAGGKIIVTKTRFLAGYIAVIIDSKGNKVGLHAEEKQQTVN